MPKGLCTYYGTYHWVCHTVEKCTLSKSQHNNPENIFLGLNSAIQVNHSANVCDSFQQNKCGCPHQNLQQDGEHSIKDGGRGGNRQQLIKWALHQSRGLNHSTLILPFHLNAANVNSDSRQQDSSGQLYPTVTWYTYLPFPGSHSLCVSVLLPSLNVLVQQN